MCSFLLIYFSPLPPAMVRPCPQYPITHPSYPRQRQMESSGPCPVLDISPPFPLFHLDPAPFREPRGPCQVLNADKLRAPCQIPNQTQLFCFPSSLAPKVKKKKKKSTETLKGCRGEPSPSTSSAPPAWPQAKASPDSDCEVGTQGGLERHSPVGPAGPVLPAVLLPP